MSHRVRRSLVSVASSLGLLVLVGCVAGGCGSVAVGGPTSESGPTSAVAVATGVDSSTTAAPSVTVESDTGKAAQTLTVSAAAGLKSAFTELGRIFDEKYNAQITFNFAAAGMLRQQIESGAPVDVFASSDPKFIKGLLEENLIDAMSVQDFASNNIVLIVKADSALVLTSFEQLADDTVEKIATGDPEITPLGAATLQMLPKLGIEDVVKPKLIYTQTVTQALDYVSRGEVDAGIVWTSEAQTAGDKVKVVASADPSVYTRVLFQIAVVSSSEKKALGQEFADFVYGAEGQAILQEHGFTSAVE